MNNCIPALMEDLKFSKPSEDLIADKITKLVKDWENVQKIWDGK